MASARRQVQPPEPADHAGDVRPGEAEALDSSTMTDPTTGTDLRNSDVSWSEFDSVSYWKNNYQVLHENDILIIRAVGEFFVECFDHGSAPTARNSIDVGSGANLYPALTMLPWSKRITLTDYSETNLKWLKQYASDLSGPWDWSPFWEELGYLPAYSLFSSPRKALAERYEVQQVSVFDLPAHKWDLGTMFFVAESITSDHAEFEAATLRFLESLVPGSPFAAAFMDGSKGYDVGRHRFPAVDITARDVKSLLSSKTQGLDVRRFEVTSKPLRAGYDGMILALGRVALS